MSRAQRRAERQIDCQIDREVGHQIGPRIERGFAPLQPGPARAMDQNVAQSLLILSSAGLIAGAGAYLLAGLAGASLIAALIIAIAASGSHLPADAMMRLYRARLLAPDDSQLSSLVDVLAYRAGLARRPDLYVIPSLTINAFATGPASHPAIAISEGLIRRLSLREIAGVIAHEMSHIRSGDLWVMGLADTATRALQGLSYVAVLLAAVNAILVLRGAETMPWAAIALLYLAPALTNLIQLALSRAREFDADASAAHLTGDPAALASALGRIDTYTGHLWEDLMPTHPARRVPEPSLLRTHPPSAERIARLHALSQQTAPDPLVIVERPMTTSMVGMGPGTLRPRYRFPGLWY